MTDAIDPVVAYARRAFASHQQALAFYLAATSLTANCLMAKETHDLA
jgi:hypothetical protein